MSKVESRECFIKASGRCPESLTAFTRSPPSCQSTSSMYCRGRRRIEPRRTPVPHKGVSMGRGQMPLLAPGMHRRNLAGLCVKLPIDHPQRQRISWFHVYKVDGTDVCSASTPILSTRQHCEAPPTAGQVDGSRKIPEIKGGTQTCSTVERGTSEVTREQGDRLVSWKGW